MAVRVPIGIDDFRKVREAGLEYIDKSDLIRQVIDRVGVEVILLPRPRRFGKSLNLSMLRYWFEKADEDLSHLFKDLSIWQAGNAYKAHFQAYPVIYFDFKGCRHSDHDCTMGLIKKKIEDLFARHQYLLTSDRLTEWQLRDFRSILDRTASSSSYERALLDLSSYLRAHHDARVIVLIDEYDEALQAGWVHDHSSKTTEFVFRLLGAALKGNANLERAIMTGTLRFHEPSTYSGLNNVCTYSLLSREFNGSFGFTGDEVVALLERAGRAEKLADVRTWYDGYLFGGEAIYNPWSVLSFLHGEDGALQAYWLAADPNDWVHDFLNRHGFRFAHIFESLLEGREIETCLDETACVGESLVTDEVLWSLLVFTGYLKADPLPYDSVLGRVVYRLAIPNREVRQLYSMTFQRWFKAHLDAQGGDTAKLTRALLSGDDDMLEKQLQVFAKSILASYDIASVDPERVVQGFILGLLAALEPDHVVRSNRDAGAGRPDVTIRPRLAGKPGALLEWKLARKGKKTPAAALREGLGQIRTKGYAADLWAAGVSEVHAFAVAFDGKRVWVKSSDAGDKKKARGKK